MYICNIPALFRGLSRSIMRHWCVMSGRADETSLPCLVNWLLWSSALSSSNFLPTCMQRWRLIVMSSLVWSLKVWVHNYYYGYVYTKLMKAPREVVNVIILMCIHDKWCPNFHGTNIYTHLHTYYKASALAYPKHVHGLIRWNVKECMGGVWSYNSHSRLSIRTHADWSLLWGTTPPSPLNSTFVSSGVCIKQS